MDFPIVKIAICIAMLDYHWRASVLNRNSWQVFWVLCACGLQIWHNPSTCTRACISSMPYFSNMINYIQDIGSCEYLERCSCCCFGARCTWAQKEWLGRRARPFTGFHLLFQIFPLPFGSNLPFWLQLPIGVAEVKEFRHIPWCNVAFSRQNVLAHVLGWRATQANSFCKN